MIALSLLALQIQQQRYGEVESGNWITTLEGHTLDKISSNKQ